MLIELANHNDDIRRLLERGYALRFDSDYLVVRDIPYLDDKGALQWGAMVTVLVFENNQRVRQHNHQVFFAGSLPHGIDGKPIPNLGNSDATLPLAKADVVVQRQFSNKPVVDGGGWRDYANFFEKIESYTRLIAGPAMELHKVSPLTFNVDNDVAGSSVFKFRNSLTSRAEIGDLAARFKDDVIAIIGLGGTGCFVLDFIVKTTVKEIRGFDGDDYFVHNAYRSGGRLTDTELRGKKAEVYQGRYENFREGLHLHPKYIDKTCAEDLKGVTFAFVCVDKGSARAEIFDLLMSLKIPFIDVGLGLNRAQGPLAGTIRTTYFSAEDAQAIREKKLVELADEPDDAYRRNVQIAELNAINACLAVLRFKQIRGFYVDTNAAYNSLMDIGEMKIFHEAAE